MKKSIIIILLIMVAVMASVMLVACDRTVPLDDYVGEYRLLTMDGNDTIKYGDFLSFLLEINEDKSYYLSYELKGDAKVIINDNGNDNPEDDVLLSANELSKGKVTLDKLDTLNFDPVEGNLAFTYHSAPSYRIVLCIELGNNNINCTFVKQ